MNQEFKDALFLEIANESGDDYTKEQVALFFSHIEEMAPHFENKGTFLSTYLLAQKLDKELFERFDKDITEHDGSKIGVISFLSADYYDLTDPIHFQSLVEGFITIGDEENTADYFEGMMTNDTFKKYLIYENHFGRNHSDLTRIGTIVFQNDEFSEKRYFDFWKENEETFKKIILNDKLQDKLPTKAVKKSQSFKI